MIRNREDLVVSSGGDSVPGRELALDCVEAGIRAAQPRRVTRQTVEYSEGTLSIAGEDHELDEYDEVVVLGGGKAAVGVAGALEAALGERIDRGVVVTDSPEDTDIDRIQVYEADHPIPSERGVAGADRILELADRADDSTLVLAIVTGGASALLPAPAAGISLTELQETTTALLESGAAISDINAVRKHCSAIKGGRLAERAAPATVVGLAVSDVVGDDLATIASGPLSPDYSTFADALGVLDRYGIDAPAAVRERLEQGARGDMPETPTAGDPTFDRVSVHVIASAMTALDAAAEVAHQHGYDPLVLSSRVRGEAREAAKTHAAIAEEIRATGNPLDPPAVVLSEGETTVTVEEESGEGGPNLEFALAWALNLDADEDANLTLASVDTDGSDGGTEVAGALVDSATVGEEIDPENAHEGLTDNDSLGVLADADCTIQTGATGTNVNDLRVLVVDELGGETES